MRSLLVKEALDFYPKEIRDAVLNDRQVRKDLGLTFDGTIKFGNKGPIFRRSLFFASCRKVFDGDASVTTVDTSEREWEMSSGEAEQPGAVTLRSNKTSFSVPAMKVLATEKATRVAAVASELASCGMVTDIADAWRALAEDRPFSDDEFSDFCDDTHCTPKVIRRTLAEIVRARSIDIEDLVPSDALYYRHLASYDGPIDVGSLNEGALQHFFRTRLGDTPLETLPICLASCARSSLSEFVSLSGLTETQMQSFYTTVLPGLDPISRVAAVEVALREAGHSPHLIALIADIVRGLIADGDATEREFLLQSSMMILSDSELVRRGTLPELTPSQRRLLAFAHAGALVAAFKSVECDVHRLSEWAIPRGINTFRAQNLLDHRLEPHWRADFVEPEQLQQETRGRLLAALDRGIKTLDQSFSSQLRALHQAVKVGIKAPMAYFPGPAEGGLTLSAPLLEEAEQAIRKEFDSEVLSFRAFFPVLAMMHLMAIPASIVDLVARSLKRCDDRIFDGIEDNAVPGLLKELARFAAVSRSVEVSDGMWSVVRRTIRLKRSCLDPHHALEIAMLSAACFSDKPSWARCFGERSLEVAHMKMSVEDAKVAHGFLSLMIRLDSSLWSTCGASEAALALMTE